MTVYYIIVAIVVLLSILTNKILYKYGVPSLIIFLLLGMVFGSDGFGIAFDNFKVAEDIASVALVFIMFYGGFGTKWDTAKPVAVKSVIMSSLGTVATAFLTGACCMVVLKVSFVHGLLFGSVVASTDAASVFYILRSRKLSLKDGIAPLLEIESGSNDPFAYLMTIVSLSLLMGDGVTALPLLLFKQIFFGIGLGVLLAAGVIVMSRYIKLDMEGVQPIFLIAVALLGYGLCGVIEGNGFLCVYIIGIIIGNSQMLHKTSMVHFFDSFSWIMQILLFFVLGLLSFPSKLPSIIIPGTIISIFMILIARPLATFGILSWFKVPIKQQMFISWVGLRGAAAIVFAIIAVSSAENLISYDLFHLVIFVAIFSIIIQGTLTPIAAKKLKIVDKDEDNSVFKTFNDYQEEGHTQLLEHKIDKGNPWIGKMILEARIPEEILVVMIKRNGKAIIAKGSTQVQEGDIIVLCADDFKKFKGQNIFSIDEISHAENVNDTSA